MLSSNIFNINCSVEYGFSLLLLNIIIYLILLFILFSVFFMFNVNKIRTLNEFKNLYLSNFIIMLFLFTLLSFAGMPPLLGFIGKFLLIIFLLLKNQYFIFFIFSVVNIFMIYFYIQNLRFVLKKTKSNINFYKNSTNALSINNFNIVIFFSFLNIFSIFFFSDILIIFNYISSFIFIN